MMFLSDRMYKDDIQTHERMCACLLVRATKTSMLGLARSMIYPEEINLIKLFLFYLIDKQFLLYIF